MLAAATVPWVYEIMRDPGLQNSGRENCSLLSHRRRGGRLRRSLFFDNVTAQTPILFCKQLSRTRKTYRRGPRRDTNDDRYVLIRDPPGSIEEQWEGIPLRQMCESTLNMLSFGNLWDASTRR